MIVLPSRGSRRISKSYIGACGPRFAIVPDWWTSKCAGAFRMPKRSVPPGFAFGSAALTMNSCAAAGERRKAGAAPAAAPATPRVFRKERRLTRLLGALKGTESAMAFPSFGVSTSGRLGPDRERWVHGRYHDPPGPWQDGFC